MTHCFKIIIAIVLLPVSIPLCAREDSCHKAGAWHIEPLVGNSWQSEYFHPVFNFGKPTAYPLAFPYGGQRNTQGFGLDIGSNIYVDVSCHSAIGIWLNGRLRYDYVYGLRGGATNPSYKYNGNNKDFIADLNFGLQYKLADNNDRSLDVVAGMTIHQVGKRYFFELKQYGWDDVWLNYQYLSYDLRLGYDIIRLSPVFSIHAGIATSYIPNGHPAYPFTDFMLLKVYAQVKFKGIKAFRI